LAFTNLPNRAERVLFIRRASALSELKDCGDARVGKVQGQLQKVGQGKLLFVNYLLTTQPEHQSCFSAVTQLQN
jgi:hypothetical protein